VLVVVVPLVVLPLVELVTVPPDAIVPTGSKNSALTTALVPPTLLVTVIKTCPCTAHTRYFPPRNDETVSVSSTLPLVASATCTVSDLGP